MFAKGTGFNMKAVILAGGLGTRIAEETHLKPKPMIEIGGRPILWHIMKIYSSHGINDFIICAGYKAYIIKEFFSNYCLHTSDVTFDIANNRIDVHYRRSEPWRVTVVDTGDCTMTGGRLRRVREYLNDDTFCFTYGDGVANIDIGALIAHHRNAGRDATLTSVQPPNRYGVLELEEQVVTRFQEKPGSGGWINGGFFVLQPSVLDLIEDDSTIWERGPLEKLATLRQLTVFKHNGFWQSMDTLRDKMHLDELWATGNAPWKIW